MKESLLDLLACPADGGTLALRAGSSRGAEVTSGNLDCATCGRSFPVTGGVPRMFVGDLPAVTRRTADAFGYEWRAHPGHHDYYRAQFFNWIHPVTAGEFADRTVLDAGCGKGRHLDVVSSCGARAAVGVDVSGAADVAYAALADRPNVHVVQASLERLPFRPVFDHAYSVGVIHHVEDPAPTVRALCARLAPGGRLSLWLYGREGNEWLLPWLLPLRRRLTVRLRFETLLAASHVFSAPLWALVKGVYRRAARDPRWAGLRARLPYRAYFEQISGFPYREIHHIVFDQLVAPLARYYTAGEARALAEAPGMTVESLSQRNGNSWAVLARRSAPAEEGRPTSNANAVRMPS